MGFELHGMGIELLALIFLAAIWAGSINTIVGSGTLVTFPVLVAMGVPPVSATVSNAMGLIAGNFTGAWGYRREIRSVRPVLVRLIPASLVGGVIGALLLLTLPEEVFGRVAPVLILISLLFVILQPRLARWVRARADARKDDVAPDLSEPDLTEPDLTEPDVTEPDLSDAGELDSGDPDAAPPEAAGPAATPDAAPETGPSTVPAVGLALFLLVFFAGIYGGYFVAAQGILLMGILGVFLASTIQQANGIKNILVAVVNLVAGISYVITDYVVRDADDRVILWGVVGIIAVGSTIGGLIGAWVGRRLSPIVLRAVIVTLGVVALAVMLRDLILG